jgi:glutamate N-acetyltransferase/amino-acid N-acetyltransferase
MDRLLPAISRAARDAVQTAEPALSASRAICTTDTREKVAGGRFGTVTVAGIAKGSGMIHPNMATMLGFLATDATVKPRHLQDLLESVNAHTFSQISVDGDMSTNDTVILLSTGEGPRLGPGLPGWEDIVTGVALVARQLARDIARDGEGARTLISVTVDGGDTHAEARDWARAVVSSSLFKAAVHGRDPNWGRIVGALGAGGALGLDSLDIDLGDVPVMREGAPVPFDEARASEAMSTPELSVHIGLPGTGRGVAWGCDLSAQYVAINADYRS